MTAATVVIVAGVTAAGVGVDLFLDNPCAVTFALKARIAKRHNGAVSSIQAIHEEK